MSTPKIQMHTYLDGYVAVGLVGALSYFTVGASRPLAIAAAKEYLLGALSELDALAQTVEPGDLKDRETCERKGE